MQLTVLRGLGRRVLGALVALALSVGLLGLAAPAASADPDRTLTVHDWVIDDLLNGGQDPHQEYWNMIAAMHRVTGHDFFRDTLDETTTNGNALFQVSVHRYGTYVGALYFWTNDLYLAGFYQAGPGGGHYAFNEPRQARFNQLLGVNSTTLPWSGSYTDFSNRAGEQGSRQNLQINGPRLDNALQQLGRAGTHLQTQNGRSVLSHALVMIIQATSEAARFGRIFNNIRTNIRDYSTGGAQMGEENVNLQQNWGTISNWTYRVLQDAGVRPLQIGTGAFLRTFATLQQLIAYVYYMELASGSRPR
ncbi:ribosome-inactivating family protein [Streptomyces heilongjiangensis]|uniref:Ribosome-inactivating family protein n=1 Tax=Streptomyces heilongjiangensis TaxID=945052 RepID=A0ABW1AYQ7_9ACTN|nr:ribosome-inactivating family protein [Streptomyces heilongjiangensis]MDC2947944.1 ribosome-inactivating family protein [Streptomyces heilongjiangensis]